MPSNVRPQAFIGCSREAIDHARAVKAHLEFVSQVTPWYTGTFGGNDYTMEALERQLDRNDFAVFVFAADDVALIRGEYVFIPRDNTVFEMGLFWGRLGRRRVYALVPRQVRARSDLIKDRTVDKFHLLSDLAGLTMLSYELRDDGNAGAAVDGACGEIAKAIRANGFFIRPAQEAEAYKATIRSKQSILHFFAEYTKRVEADPAGRYAAFSEAVRNSLLVPADYRVNGAAMWQRLEDDSIVQVGGNVGIGKRYHLRDNDGKTDDDQKAVVVEVFKTNKWTVYTDEYFADVYVLCYPLGRHHVLSVHIAGNGTHDELLDEELNIMVQQNKELFRTIRFMVGGDSL